jgi:hypothetical protein
MKRPEKTRTGGVMTRPGWSLVGAGLSVRGEAGVKSLIHTEIVFDKCLAS